MGLDRDVAPVLLLIAFLGAVLWMERGRRADPPASPLEILDRRYAQGEIGEEEYERLRASLMG
jgi:uncharacterized membrane protein